VDTDLYILDPDHLISTLDDLFTQQTNVFKTGTSVTVDRGSHGQSLLHYSSSRLIDNIAEPVTGFRSIVPTVDIFPQTISADPPDYNPPPVTINTSDSLQYAFMKYKQCGVCGKAFSKRGRAQTCENKHHGTKPYWCTGRCGNVSWSV
jgi:hypothetical protein